MLSVHACTSCMTGGRIDLYKQHVKGSASVRAAGETGRAEGIVRSQRHSVSGCKLLQLDSTPTRLLHNLIHSSLCSVRGAHILIVMWYSSAMAEWHVHLDIPSVALWVDYSFPPFFGKIQKKLYCALKSIFPSPISEVGWLSFTNKESLKNSWLIIFPKTENKAVRRVQVLIIKWSGEAGRGWGCCICVVRGRWENLRQEENMMFPSLHLSLRAEETKEHTVNWGWTKTRHLDFTLRVLCQCLWVV